MRHLLGHAFFLAKYRLVPLPSLWGLAPLSEILDPPLRYDTHTTRSPGNISESVISCLLAIFELFAAQSYNHLYKIKFSALQTEQIRLFKKKLCYLCSIQGNVKSRKVPAYSVDKPDKTRQTDVKVPVLI